MTIIQVGQFSIELTLKKIKHIYLTVSPPNGNITISAPLGCHIDQLRTFITKKQSWLIKQQLKYRNQHYQTPKKFIENESHYYQGQCYPLYIEYTTAKPEVVITPQKLTLVIGKKHNQTDRKRLLNEWYRARLKESIPPIIKQYEPLMKVQVAEFNVKLMKTRWGTCNIRAKRIWLNLELAKKSLKCLEYVVVHEMTHLLEASHNHRFKALMTDFLPQWRSYKDELNQ